MASVDKPILGSDFLAANQFSVDVAEGKLSNKSGVILQALPIDNPGTRLFHVLAEHDPDVAELLAGFPEVLGTKFANINSKHGVSHKILTDGHPVHAQARRLDPIKLNKAKEEFDKMEQAGIITRSDSQWSSPWQIVMKKDGSYRPCGDFRRLNNITILDRYPLPLLQDFAANLTGSSHFSKLDLLKGYYQIPMADSDKLKTAVITPFGL